MSYRKIIRKIISCNCGCGQTLEDLDKKARPRRFIAGHSSRIIRYWAGRKFSEQHIQRIKIARERQEIKTGSPAFKGGRNIASNGYVRIWHPGHPSESGDGYILEHRLVMEQIIGRHLLPGEVIHHKNHNRSDNDPSNLQLFSSHSDHMSIGHGVRKLSI